MLGKRVQEDFHLRRGIKGVSVDYRYLSVLRTFLTVSFFNSCILVVLITSCNTDQQKDKTDVKTSNAKLQTSSDTLTSHLKPFNEKLPTIGLLMYNGVLACTIHESKSKNTQF
jgi:hypothetical protein